MTGCLTVDELAERSGVTVESLEQWRALGLIGREDDAVFAPADVHRAQLIRLLLRRGVSVDALAQAERAERFLERYLVSLSDRGGPVYSVAQAAEQIGLDAGVLRRIVEAAGLGREDEPLFDEDVRMLRGAKTILESGLPEDALLQLLRVYTEALGRVADAESRLFHFYVHERLRAAGTAGSALHAATDAARDHMMPLVEPTILYFHRKGFARAAEDDALLHLQDDTGLAIRGQLRLAVVFVDLAGFTPLADAMGDEVAADVVGRFALIVHDAVRRSTGRAVKQIGDAFMLVFSDARAAVSCALDIQRQAMSETQFPAVRGGIQWGDVLYRAGDYLGANVNIAARLAAAAERHQVLVSAAVKNEAAGAPGIEFVPLGRRRLKGVTEEVDAFAAVEQSAADAEERLVDVVCGMELRPSTIVARLLFEGEERVFCSATCLQRFVESPERYGARLSKDTAPGQRD